LAPSTIHSPTNGSSIWGILEFIGGWIELELLFWTPESTGDWHFSAFSQHCLGQRHTSINNITTLQPFHSIITTTKHPVDKPGMKETETNSLPSEQSGTKKKPTIDLPSRQIISTHHIFAVLCLALTIEADFPRPHPVVYPSRPKLDRPLSKTR
jgi:hypothetical protein